jgi:DNA-binding response OmpR family regulator
MDLLDTNPSCVVVDLRLPDGNGESVLRRIREEGIDSRVIICTAVRDEDRLEGLRTLAPDAVVYKPIEIKDLLEACRV